jgi:hypothetical protein
MVTISTYKSLTIGRTLGKVSLTWASFAKLKRIALTALFSES